MSKSHSPSSDTLKLRPVRESDYAELNRLLAPSDFDDGEHNLRLFHRHSGANWVVAINASNEIIAVDMYHVISLKLTKAVMRTVTVVREDYQNRGVARLFTREYDYAYVGNCTADMMQKKRGWHDVYGAKMVGFAGRPCIDQLRKLQIDQSDSCDFQVAPPTSKEDFQRLTKYDRSIIDIDRESFMREWCAKSEPDQPFSRTLIAKSSSGAILGFGTIRLFTRVYEIQPLYAENPGIALQILRELIKLYHAECDLEKPIRLYFNAKNRTMIKFVHDTKMEHAVSLVVMYKIGRNGRWGLEQLRECASYEKVYTAQYYWPV